MSALFYQDQVLLDKSIIHLNHAGVGPWLRATVDAITSFAIENANYSSLRFRQWEIRERQLRELCAALLNAPSSEDIAFLKNTSEGLSCVAFGYPWQPGDNVVFAQQEFPSNRVVWEALQNTHGVEPRRVDLLSAISPEQALIDAVDQHTRVIAVSAVQYADGLRMNLQAIARHCQSNDILLCVDAIQALGVVPVDVQSTGIDIAVADAHKWLLAPEGIAIFYISHKARDKIQPTQFGWHNLEHTGDFQTLDWQLSASARRYECGSLNNLGIQALLASLQCLVDVGINTVFEQVTSRIHAIAHQLDSERYSILSDLETSRSSGIITIKHRTADSMTLYSKLLQQGILCAMRNGGIRLSPHFYTPMNQIEHVTDLLNHY
jgi:selenocysteine lyase/cysteine desulfurase